MLIVNDVSMYVFLLVLDEIECDHDNIICQEFGILCSLYISFNCKNISCRNYLRKEEITRMESADETYSNKRIEQGLSNFNIGEELVDNIEMKQLI